MDTRQILGVLVAILSLSVLIAYAGSQNGITYTDYRHPAINIGDGKNTNLSGTIMGFGRLADVTCLQNCTNFSGGSAKIVYANQYGTLQAAVNAGDNNSMIIISPGTYTLSTAALSLSKHDQEINCIGKPVIIASGNFDVMGGSDQQNLSIHGCVLQGNAQNGMSFTNGSNFRIWDNEIRGASLKGIDFDGGHNNRIWGNWIHENGQEAVVIAADPTYLYPTMDYWIYDNTFENNGGYNGVGTVTQTATIYISNVNVFRNFINNSRNTAAYNINMIGCYNCSIKDNIILGGSAAQITLGNVGTQYQNANYTIVSGNRLYGVAAGSDAIRIQAGYNNTIVNNYIYGTGVGFALEINGYKGNIVMNNFADNMPAGAFANSPSQPFNLFKDNYGASPYNWGVLTRTAANGAVNFSAFGAGDTFINTSTGKNDLCISTAAGPNSWVFAGNRTGSC